MAPMMEPPTRAFAVGHFDKDKSTAALRCLLASSCEQPQVVALKREPSLAEVEMWLAEDEDEQELDLPHLEAYRAGMRFGYAAERLGEGQHADLHRTNLRAPNHTVAYDSVDRRMNELKQHLELDTRYAGQ